MTDVFISYAREDRKFVQRLHDALATEGRESWVDWEGIPASAKWMAEVRAAIDEADCFCFVVSPDSVESPVCREEAAHAAASNKRILPLLHREVADGLVPETVAAHNWIEFDGQSDFDQAFATLVKALETEPEHLRAHTRLLVRSKEWESSERDRSHLLRGQDLSQAEGWLSTSAGKEPAPTQGQTAYVLTSRKAASRRQRTVVGAVAIALVLSLVLSAVAIVQRGEAKDAQALAEEQTQVANSRALAAQALLNLEDELDVGILLALEAYRTAPSPEALDVLHIAAQRSLWIERTLRVHEDGVNQVSYSLDGAFMASASADGAVILSDPTSGTPLHPPLRADSETVLGLAIDPTGTQVATGGGEGIVRFWDVGSGSEVGSPIEIRRGGITALAFSPDGDHLAAGTGRGDVLLLDSRTREIIGQPLSIGRSAVWALAFAPEGRMLAAGDEESGVLQLLDVTRWTGLEEVATGAKKPGALWSLAFSPDGRTLGAGILSSTASGDGRILLWDARSLAPIDRTFEGHTDSVFDIAFSPNGEIITSGSADGTVRLWSADSGELIGTPLQGHTDWVNSVAFHPGGGTVSSAGADGRLITWDVEGHLAGREGPIGVVDFAPDGETMVSAGPVTFDDGAVVGWGALTLWDTERWEVAVQPVENEKVYTAAFAPDGSWIAGGTLDGTLLRWDATSLSALGDPLEGPARYQVSVAVSPDATLVASGTNDGAVVIWDVETESVVRTIDAHKAWVAALAFSPDGKTLASGSLDGSIALTEMAPGTESTSASLAEELGGVYALGHTSDGAVLASGTFLGHVLLWDPKTGEQMRDIDVNAGVLSVEFSPDDRVIAVGTEGGTTSFFDVQSGRPIGQPIEGQRDWVNSLSFIPDGTLLAAGSEDGSILLYSDRAWTDDADALTADLCEIAGRSLTRAEWEEFVPFAPYHATCGATE